MIIAVDLDGTLCLGEAWTAVEASEAQPIKKMIVKVNDLYQSNFIVIYTARKDQLLPATVEWLRRNNVKYHAISNLKMGCDLYIDDKSVRPEEVYE